MTVLNLIANNEAEDNAKTIVKEGVTYLIYPYLIKDPLFVEHRLFPEGKNYFRKWSEMSYCRLLGPNAINIESIPNEDIDLYTYETDLPVDIIKGQILFCQHDYMFPVFNKDYHESILIDLISNFILNVLDDNESVGFASLSLFNSLVSSYIEREMKETTVANKITQLKPLQSIWGRS